MKRKNQNKKRGDNTGGGCFQRKVLEGKTRENETEAATQKEERALALIKRETYLRKL